MHPDSSVVFSLGCATPGVASVLSSSSSVTSLSLVVCDVSLSVVEDVGGAEGDEGEEDAAAGEEGTSVHPASSVVFSFGCATPGVASVISSSSSISSTSDDF